MSLSTVYLILYCYTHSLANQLHGAEEDALNKPFRPIPSGMTSAAHTRARFAVVSMAYLAIGWSLELLLWTLLWLATVALYNFAGWDRRWWIKNLYPPTGYLVQSVAAWKIGGSALTPLAWTWILLGVGYWQLVFIQDLRDVIGDRRVARTTLPILIGEGAVKKLGSAGLALMVAVTWWLTLPLGGGTPRVVWLIVFTVCCGLVAVRLTVLRSARADNITYQLYAAFSIILGVGALV